MSKIYKAISLIGFLSICAAAVWFQQRQITTVEAQTETPKLTFEVLPRQNSYLLREPIPFDFKLSNQTNVPVKSGSKLTLRETNFLVRGENGENTVWEMSKYSLDGSPSGLIDVQPGGKRESEQLLGGTMAEMMFPRPGVYEVQVEYVYEHYEPQREQPETIKYLSNTFTLNILEPQGVNKRAYNYLKGAYETARRGSDSALIRQRQQYFVDTFADSVYAKYMIVELAIGYEYASDSAKAVRELCKIYTADFFHKKEIRRSLLRVNARLHPVVIPQELPANMTFLPVPHPCTGVPINPRDFLEN